MPRVWPVGALCRAVADALDARFNPVTVAGEISGFSRASSGHCYFVIRDDAGQLRCAMFKRAAGLLPFSPRDGERVEVRGRLGVYEPRGELQLVVESMSRVGQGNLFEQFTLLKAKLELEGLFASSRKRPVAALPRAIGLVTSLGAAALHDVVTTLQRRVPHVPVILAPSSVQGDNAPQELIAALDSIYALGSDPDAEFSVDTILLVRGGGSMEDLWAFNHEALARTIARSPVPLISGVGHETDFTIADFVADVRAPTPTAAAELAAVSGTDLLDDLARWERKVIDAKSKMLQREAQRVDQVTSRLGRPSVLTHQRRLELAACERKLSQEVRRSLDRHNHNLSNLAVRLSSVDPRRVLQRGYAWLTDPHGDPVTTAMRVHEGQPLVATLADGAVEMTVNAVRLN
jgi:exodeoxyribonuclease VII large subunit